jgi:chromosome partitioning protein
MIITLCNGKGGSGKTTLAVLLSHALAEAGRRVALLDLDPQGTASNWLRECGMKVAMYESGTEYDAVFIDTPPRLESLPAALASCSVAVIVCSPSPADLWTTQDTAAAIRPNLPQGASLRLLFNGVSANTILSRDLPSLAKHIGVKPLKTTISRRQCYQHAALIGWAALDPAARDEVFKAALEIITTDEKRKR